MNEEEKEPFLELSRRDRERWQKDKALEKKPRDPNRPKRPPSAYFLFLADFRKTYPGKADPAKVRILIYFSLTSLIAISSVNKGSCKFSFL